MYSGCLMMSHTRSMHCIFHQMGRERRREDWVHVISLPVATVISLPVASPQFTMEFTLFTILMIFTLAFRPAEMEKCFKVTDLVQGQCTFQNSTTLSPNEQVTNAITIEHFKPLFSSSCSPYSRILVCSTFVPFCVSSHRQVQPCRHLCLKVK